jgi:hypothetical protein
LQYRMEPKTGGFAMSLDLKQSLKNLRVKLTQLGDSL